MDSKKKHVVAQLTSPFDTSARSRLRHMGVIDEKDKVDSAVMPVFAGIFSGLFFDDFCDHFYDPKDLWTIYHIFMQLFERKDYEHMYLFISIQYDSMRKPMPDPVWWLAGNKAAVKEFMGYFIHELSRFMVELGLLDSREAE